MRLLGRERDLFYIQNKCENNYRSHFISEEASKKRTNKGFALMVMNSDELEEGLNVDLRGRKKETYGCRVAAEGCRVTLVKPG